LETLFTGKIIHFKEEVASTNDWADQAIKTSKVLEGTAFRAGMQTQGKGQRGRVWNSDSGLNVLISFVFHPHFLGVSEQFGLVKMVSLALKDLLDPYLIERAQIKWPNDIYVNDSKISGVLIESSMKGANLGSSIVGIGLNVNQTKFENEHKATSLMLESGRGIDLDRLVKELSVHLEKRYLSLRANSASLDEAYESALYKHGLAWNYEIDGNKQIMINRGVDLLGQLILEDEYGRVNAYGLHQARMMI
jgi:BirA family biotin operon repressor/biotin-[acetyl-CoA-carboxylase] ligase